MIRYVAFLRGINVSGHKIIKMATLKQMFISMAFNNVVTYIQSGNVVFDCDTTDVSLLNTNIETYLKSELGYDVRVIIRTISELQQIIANNPYHTLNDGDTRKVGVTFLAGIPPIEKTNGILKKSEIGDEICIIDRDIYILYHSFGNSMFTNTYIEKKLGTKGTCRNWATINKLIEL